MSQTPTTGGNLYRAVYAGVAVVECHILGTVVMRRCEDCFINATQILKAADLDKPRRTRILERQIHPYEHEKVQGGYGRYQGTWIPLPGAVVLAREHGVYADLQQLLELTPEQLARLPTVPRQRAVSGNSGGGVASPRSTNQAAAKRKNTAAPILPARRAAPGSSALGKSTGGGTRGGGGYSSAGVPSGSSANTGYVGNGNNTESLEYTPQPKRVRVGYTPTTTAAVSAYSTSSTGPKPLGPPGANVLPTPNSISTQSSHSVLTPTAPRGTGLMAAGTPHSPIWPLASPLGKPPPGALLRMPGLTRHPDSRRGSTSHRSAMDMGDGNHGEDQPGDETETDGSEYEDRTDAERRPLVGGATRPGSSPSLAPIYKYQPELGHRPLALFAQPSVSMAARSKVPPPSLSMAPSLNSARSVSNFTPNPRSIGDGSVVEPLRSPANSSSGHHHPHRHHPHSHQNQVRYRSISAHNSPLTRMPEYPPPETPTRLLYSNSRNELHLQPRTSQIFTSLGQYVRGPLSPFTRLLIRAFHDDPSLPPPSFLVKPLPDCRMDDPIDTHLNTTLHWAAAYGRLEMIEVLIKHGADLGLLNQNHQWALVTAVVGVTMGPSRLPDSECPDSVELLNRTVTHSSRYGVGAFPRILALLHPTLMCVSPSGWSVFHYLVDATRHRQLSPVLAHYYLQSLLNYFIEHRLNPDIIAHRNHEGHTALDMTLQTQGHPSLQVLVDSLQSFMSALTTPLPAMPNRRHSSYSNLPPPTVPSDHWPTASSRADEGPVTAPMQPSFANNGPWDRSCTMDSDDPVYRPASNSPGVTPLPSFHSHSNTHTYAYQPPASENQGTQGFTTMTTPLFTPPRPRHPHQRRTSLQVIRESPGKPFAYDRHAPAATALSPLGPKPMGGPHRVFTAPQPLMGLGSFSTQAAGQSSTTGTGSPPTMGRKPHVERPSASSEVASAQMNCTSSSPAHATDSYNRGPPVPTPDSARDQAARLRLPLRRRSFLGLASVTHRPPVPSSPAVPSTEPTPSRVATANTVVDESTGGPPLRSQAPVDLAPMDHCAQPSDRYDRAIGTLTDHVSDVVRTRRIDHLDTLKEYWQQQRLLAQTLAIVKAETQRIRQETQALKAGLDEPYQVRGRSDGSQPGPNSVSSETKPGSQLVISTKVEAQAEAQALQEVARAALSQRLQECVCRYQGQLERHASSQPDRDRTPPLSTAPMTPKVCSLGRQDSALANTETREASTPPSQHTHTVFTSPFLPSRRSSMSSVLRSPSQAVSPPDSPSDIRPLGWNAQDQSAKPAPPNQAKSGDTVSPAMAATDADLVEFLKRECTTRQANLIQLVPTLLSTLLEKDCLDLPAVGYCLDRMDDALQTAVQRFANSLASHDKAQQLSTSTSPGLPPSSSTATATATTAKLTFSSPAPSSPISEGQSTPTGRGHGEAAAPTTLYNPQHGLAPLPPPSPISLLPGSTGAIRSSTDLDSASPEPTTGIPPLVLPSVVVGPRDRMAMYQQILAKGIGMPYHRIESSLPDILKSLEKKVRQQQRIRQQPPMAISSK